jgi:hypothetical protein
MGQEPGRVARTSGEVETVNNLLAEKERRVGDSPTDADHWQQSAAILRRVRQALELRFPIVLPRSFSLEGAKPVRGVVLDADPRRAA